MRARSRTRMLDLIVADGELAGAHWPISSGRIDVDGSSPWAYHGENVLAVVAGGAYGKCRFETWGSHTGSSRLFGVIYRLPVYC